MDENVKNDAKQVMLVQNADDGRLQAVTGVDQDGNIQTADPTDQNVASLLNVNTHANRLCFFCYPLHFSLFHPLTPVQTIHLAASGLPNPSDC